MLSIKKLVNIDKGRFNLLFTLLVGFSFFLPINQRLSTLTLLILTICSLFYIRRFDIIFFKHFIPFYILYILYGIAYYRDTYEIYNLMFERKAILVATPLVLSVFKLKEVNFKIILKAFIYGCVIAYLLSLFLAFCRSISVNPLSFDATVMSHRANELVNPNASLFLTSNFLSVNFTLDMNPTVLAMYFCMSIAILHSIKEVFTKQEKQVFTVVLIIGIIQFGSVLGLVMLSFVLLSILKPKLKKVMIIAGLFCFIMALIGISQKEKQNVLNTANIEKLDNRIIIWHTVLNSINKNNFLFGVGAEKAQKLLDKNYPKVGDFGFASQIKKLDSHNMYLQFILEIGLIGFMVYLISIYSFIRDINKIPMDYRNLSIIFIGLSLFLNVTECSFNIYIGLSFFTFFYVLILAYKHQENLLQK